MPRKIKVITIKPIPHRRSKLPKPPKCYIRRAFTLKTTGRVVRQTIICKKK